MDPPVWAGLFFSYICDMKKILLLAFVLLFAADRLSAQKYEPHDTWPFVYEDFKEGAARTKSGALVSEAKFNISVQDGSLLYIGQDGVLMKADMQNIYTARLGEDVFINVYGKMYQVLNEVEGGAVLLGKAVDEDALGKVSIGYGISSSTGSSRNATNLVEGRFNLIQQSIEKITKDKYTGAVLPVRETRYLLVDGVLIPAARSEVLSWPGVDKKETSGFLKTEKIKWKDAESLGKLVNFLSQQLNK